MAQSTIFDHLQPARVSWITSQLSGDVHQYGAITHVTLPRAGDHFTQPWRVVIMPVADHLHVSVEDAQGDLVGWSQACQDHGDAVRWVNQFLAQRPDAGA